MLKIKAKDWISIPNIISYFRIILAFLFLYIYQQDDISQKSINLGIILICSGISDVLDGYIARKYSMITELGKCLDPVADKLTQFVLLICLVVKYPMAKVTLCIFIAKEFIVTTTGFKVIRMQGKNDGAKWYGKLSTSIFYIVIIVLILFSEWSESIGNLLLAICSIALLGAFIGYMGEYVKVFKEKKKVESTLR